MKSNKFWQMKSNKLDFLFRSIKYNSMNSTHCSIGIGIMIFILLVAVYCVTFGAVPSDTENFTDSEALQNVSSMYNSGKVTATEIVTGKITGLNNNLIISGTITSDALTQMQNDINQLKSQIITSYGCLTAENSNQTNGIDRPTIPGNTLISSYTPTVTGKNFVLGGAGVLKYTGPSGKTFAIMAQLAVYTGNYYDILLKLNGTQIARADGDGDSNQSAPTIISAIKTLSTNDVLTLSNGVRTSLQLERYSILAWQID